MPSNKSFRQLIYIYYKFVLSLQNIYADKYMLICVDPLCTANCYCNVDIGA